MKISTTFRKIGNFFLSKPAMTGFLVALTSGILLELTGIYLLMIAAGALGGMFMKKGWMSFVMGTAAVAAAWSLYFLVYAIAGPLGALMELVEAFVGISGGILIAVTIVIGGLLGGFGALIATQAIQVTKSSGRETESVTKASSAVST